LDFLLSKDVREFAWFAVARDLSKVKINVQSYAIQKAKAAVVGIYRFRSKFLNSSEIVKKLSNIFYVKLGCGLIEVVLKEFNFCIVFSLLNPLSSTSNFSLAKTSSFVIV